MLALYGLHPEASTTALGCQGRGEIKFISSASIRKSSIIPLAFFHFFHFFHINQQALVWWHCSVCKEVPVKSSAHLPSLSPLISWGRIPQCLPPRTVSNTECVCKHGPSDLLQIYTPCTCVSVSTLTAQAPFSWLVQVLNGWAAMSRWQRFLSISVLLQPKSSLGSNLARSWNTTESRIWLRECFPVLFPTAFHYHLLNL